MRLLEPVVETFNVIGFAAWPVTEPTPDRRLRLSGGMSAEDVGAAIAVMVPQHLLETHNHPGQAPDLIRSLTHEECLIATGGLLLTNTATGIIIPPGCCGGVEDWRAWTEISSGGQPWLGHSPAPWVEHLDSHVRVWADGGNNEIKPDNEPSVLIPLTELADLLHSVQRDLQGFVDAVTHWAAGLAPDVAADLVTQLDQSFRITEPLDSTAATPEQS
jgi:hypothetical protein